MSQQLLASKLGQLIQKQRKGKRSDYLQFWNTRNRRQKKKKDFSVISMSGFSAEMPTSPR